MPERALPTPGEALPKFDTSDVDAELNKEAGEGLEDLSGEVVAIGEKKVKPPLPPREAIQRKKAA